MITDLRRSSDVDFGSGIILQCQNFDITMNYAFCHCLAESMLNQLFSVLPMFKNISNALLLTITLKQKN